MNRFILISLCLFKLSLFTSSPLYYRPMSKKSIDFGDDVCYYEDISDSSKLRYVKGCPSGKSCELVSLVDDAVDKEYQLHTCQDIIDVSKKRSGETCDNLLFECDFGLDCDATGKCSTSGSPSNVCKTIKIEGTNECITDSSAISTIGNLCYKKDSEAADAIEYKHLSTSKECIKLQLATKTSNEGQYYIKSKEIVDLYSVQDGDYVEENSNLYCQSGFSLFFFGNGKMKNSASDTEMFKRCVTILALKKISSDKYIIKFKINDGNEYIYDTSELSSAYKSKQNTECDVELLMVKLKIFKYLVEEYKKNGLNSNALIKWEYLYENPKIYLLYKDQTDVLDYLIQRETPSYIPEKYDTETPPNTQETELTDAITENQTSSSRLLDVRYLSMLLFLFFL